jgi:hypothetical protein
VTSKSSIPADRRVGTPERRPEGKVPREPRCCAGCGEPSGSISEGTGFPLVRDRESGRMYHVRCLPGNLFLDAQWSCLERLGS